MVTRHVHIESSSVERLNGIGNRRIGLSLDEKSRYGPLARIWARVRGNSVLATVSRQVLAFHDWISDPPMTERDRIEQYIVEARNASKRRRLAGR